MGVGVDLLLVVGFVGFIECEVLVEVCFVVEVFVFFVVVFVFFVVVEVILVEDEDVVEEEEGGWVEEDDEEEEEEDDFVEDVDEWGGFSIVLCVIVVLDLKVEVGVFGIGVVGSILVVRFVLLVFFCFLIVNVMYWCVLSFNFIFF